MTLTAAFGPIIVGRERLGIASLVVHSARDERATSMSRLNSPKMRLHFDELRLTITTAQFERPQIVIDRAESLSNDHGPIQQLD